VPGAVGCPDDGVALPVDRAHGAVVVPPGGGKGVEEVHGALVGWFGPLGADGGIREGTRDDVHGAVAMPPLLVGIPDSAIGSRNAGCGLEEGVALGWLVVCTLACIF
jgi:hypothetical protein